MTDATTQTVVFVITVDNRPGMAQAVAAVFAHRGLSIDTLVTDSGRTPTRLIVEFHGTPHHQRMIARALERLHHVSSVQVCADDAPGLVAVALVRLAPRRRMPRLTGVVVDTGAARGTRLIHGPLPAVRDALTRLQTDGIASEVARSLVALSPDASDG